MATVATQGQCELLTFADMTKIVFEELYAELDVANAPEKRKADIIDSIWPEIYDRIFKPTPDEILYNNGKSKLIPYMVEDVEAVCRMFIILNRRYGGVIKYNTFSELTGIHRDTIDRWHKANTTRGYIFNLSDNDLKDEYNNIYILYKGNDNYNITYRGNGKDVDNNKLSSIRYDVKKKLQEAMQDSNTNGLSNDTMGHALRANNEDELGKLYEPRRMVQQEQIKRVLTAQELPKLGEITSEQQSYGQIAQKGNTENL